MRRFLVVFALAAVLTGCASSGAHNAYGGADALRTCEGVIYDAVDASDATALQCASIVGVWE